MEHSISEVARMAGVTSRTLRHYDDIRLLHPARVASNGYRWYGRSELARLQRILLLRELGVALPLIRQVLDGDTDELASLRRHRDHLIAERDRLEHIIITVDRTIAHRCGTADLSDEEFFQGLTVRRDVLQHDLKNRFATASITTSPTPRRSPPAGPEKATSTPPSRDASSSAAFLRPAWAA